jgi:hypothetical protein
MRVTIMCAERIEPRPQVQKKTSISFDHRRSFLLELFTVLKLGPARRATRDSADLGLGPVRVEVKTCLGVGPVKPGRPGGSTQDQVHLVKPG